MCDFRMSIVSDTRVQDGHQVADRRCTTLYNAKWVLIDPGAQTEKKGWPCKEPFEIVSVGGDRVSHRQRPVSCDHNESRKEHARRGQAICANKPERIKDEDQRHEPTLF